MSGSTWQPQPPQIGRSGAFHRLQHQTAINAQARKKGEQTMIQK